MKKTFFFLASLITIFYFVFNPNYVFAVSESEIEFLQGKFPKGSVQSINEDQFLVEWCEESYPEEIIYCIDNYYYRGSGTSFSAQCERNGKGGSTKSDNYKFCRPNSVCKEFINSSGIKEATCEAEEKEALDKKKASDSGTSPANNGWSELLSVGILLSLLAIGFILYRSHITIKKKIIIAIIAIIILVIVYWFSQLRSPSIALSEKEKSCIDSGGTILMSQCCKSSEDFPSSCLISACGCSSDNSHEIKTCDCGEGKCFDGEKCSSTETTPVPSIDSISPNSGPIGTVVEIRGKNFPGFEGEIVFIENTEGVKGFIYGEAGSDGNLIRFTLKSSFCQSDTSYSGLPCADFIYLTPGVYKIYAMSWGIMSNAVNFTVTSSQ